MFQDLTDFNQSIYHFTTASTGLMYILPTLNLKLSSIVDVNDPKENKSFGFGSIYTEFEDWHKETWAKITFESFIKKTCKLTCFCGDYTIKENGTDFLKFGFDHPTMWAHYADSYRGMCIVLDEQAFKDQIGIDNDKFFFDSIQYRNIIDFPPIIKNDYDEDRAGYFEKYIKKNHESFFFQKYCHWSHEHEKRLVHIGKQEFISLQNSLKGIYIGPEFDKRLDNLLDLIIKKDIWISQLKIKDGNLFPIDYRSKK
jgi:hypothetical protein